MNNKLATMVLTPLLAAGLLLAPLPALSGATVEAAAAPAAVAATKSPLVYVDGKKLTLSASAFAQNGVTFVPMRNIFGALHASVTWEPKTQTIIGRKSNITITLTVGQKTALINGKAVKLDAAPIVKGGVTFVPVRFISQSLGATVKWDSAANTIRITSPEEAERLAYEKWLEQQANIPKLSTKQIVDKYDQSVVLISTNVAQGSGVVIGDNLILTNYHVIVDATSATAMMVNGEALNIVGVVHYDETDDLAIVKTEESIGVPAVEIGYGMNTDKGSKVVAIGSPLGFQNTVSEGVISNIIYQEGVRYLQISAPIDHGSSGGALFGDTGELIGITSGGMENTTAHLNVAVSVMHAAMLFEGVSEQMIKDAKFLPPSLPDTLAGAPFAEVKKLMEEQFGSVQLKAETATFTNWEVKRDAEGWYVISADIDPLFYMYYGPASADELRIWAANLGYELNRMLPDEKIQFIVSYDRVLTFEPRGYEENEVTPAGDGKWRLRFPVIDMQVKDQLVIDVKQ
ncbi:stalk domain-containing protein [Paenibacillus harenae]|uniref:S1-C subfamily serine protease n=1 Tax=Paenibacillus harenae TaxID=306543 RepID=A0ABT9TUR8_PAEHA|nr:stalk domain-containing protein [Paenibacillus harenae]MDQ0111106.1 S1-C subfamily serine protease [Paenibacillus harenae]